MANTLAMCTSFKTEVLNGIHAIGIPPVRASAVADAFKAALFLTTATINAATTAYAVTGEATGTNYTAGGIAVPNATVPGNSGTTSFWTPSGSLVYTNVSVGPVDCVLLYNSTQGNRAVSAHTFGAQTVTAGNLTLTMPTNDAVTGLLRVA